MEKTAEWCWIAAAARGSLGSCVYVKANPLASIRLTLCAGVGDFCASCVKQGSEAAAIARVTGHKLACEFGNPELRGFWVLGGHKGNVCGVI